MESQQQDSSLETLQHIRSIMERSARFLSLSGWSGIWAGAVALAGAAIAGAMIGDMNDHYRAAGYTAGPEYYALPDLMPLVLLALAVLCSALLGGFYFTYRKNKMAGVTIWNSASRRMLLNLFIPLAAGAVVVLAFLLRGDWIYAGPACLIFYGLALINGSKYTVSDIKYLGLTEVLLGCLGLFLQPGYGLYLWATGFGVLHIVYGIIMWRKYDRQ